jgi:hypothetical protein
MKRCIIIAAWSVALGLSAFAQNPPLQTPTLVLEATIPGTPASGFIVRDQVAARDFNDDGVPDLAFINPSTQLIVIVDGTNPENRWSTSGDADDRPTEEVAFIKLEPGDGLGGGLKAIILLGRQGPRYVNPVIIDTEGSLLWDGSGRVLMAIDDRGADLTERMVVFNPQVPQVEIWRADNN